MSPRWLLLAYGVANVVLYSMLLPLWEGFDEPFHFGYVQYLANRGSFPDPRTARLSEEVGVSLLLTPASPSVKRNLPAVTSFSQFFEQPKAEREQTHRQLRRIDSGLRWQASGFIDYEAQQAPLAYAVLALPERTLAKLPLPDRVLILRIIAGTLGTFLLFFGAERVARQLGIADPFRSVAIFCMLSSQMVWATLAHVANDWLAVPLTVWLLAVLIDYHECPNPRRTALVWTVLSIGLLTKAYFIAFIPLAVSICVFRRRWRHLAAGLGLVLVLSGPWYLRNVRLYGAISGMQELRQGTDPTAAVEHFRIEQLPAAVESYARAALWTANNTFRSFSTNTLRFLIAAWVIALFLWAVTRHGGAEWIVLLHCGLFALALAYDIAINYVASRGETSSPCAWYTQVLMVPLLILGMLGTSRSGKPARILTALMILLFGYVLVATYWLKLIPLYGGFEGRASCASLAGLYGSRVSALMAGLSQVSLAPAVIIVFVSALVSMLAVWQQVILIRELLSGMRPRYEMLRIPSILQFIEEVRRRFLAFASDPIYRWLRQSRPALLPG